eukprot:365721-Chlamydomonas_euryale.AAC.15
MADSDVARQHPRATVLGPTYALDVRVKAAEASSQVIRDAVQHGGCIQEFDQVNTAGKTRRQQTWNSASSRHDESTG